MGRSHVPKKENRMLRFDERDLLNIPNHHFVWGQSSWGRMVIQANLAKAIARGDFDHESGGVDYERIADAGARIWVFVNKETLDPSAERLPYIAGDWKDLGLIIGRKPSQFHKCEHVPNPLQNLRSWDKVDSPHIAVCEVSRDKFRLTFGTNALSFRFSKQEAE